MKSSDFNQQSNSTKLYDLLGKLANSPKKYIDQTNVLLLLQLTANVFTLESQRIDVLQELMKKVPAVKDLILNIRKLAEVYNDITGTDIKNQIIEGTVLEYFPIPKNEIIDNNNQNESYFWSSDSSSDEVDEYGFEYKNNEQLTNVYCDEGSKNN